MGVSESPSLDSIAPSSGMLESRTSSSSARASQKRLGGKEVQAQCGHVGFVLLARFGKLALDSIALREPMRTDGERVAVPCCELGLERGDAVLEGAASILEIVSALQGMKELELERSHLLAIGEVVEGLGPLMVFEERSVRVCGHDGRSSVGGLGSGQGARS